VSKVHVAKGGGGGRPLGSDERHNAKSSQTEHGKHNLVGGKRQGGKKKKFSGVLRWGLRNIPADLTGPEKIGEGVTDKKGPTKNRGGVSNIPQSRGGRRLPEVSSQNDCQIRPSKKKPKKNKTQKRSTKPPFNTVLRIALKSRRPCVRWGGDAPQRRRGNAGKGKKVQQPISGPYQGILSRERFATTNRVSHSFYCESGQTPGEGGKGKEIHRNAQGRKHCCNQQSNLPGQAKPFRGKGAPESKRAGL